MKRHLAGGALLMALVLVTSGHIGDNNTHFQGDAGPYPIQVVVRHPGVVPGLASITVRVNAPDVTRVTVQPVRSDIGSGGSPEPDVAEPVPGDTHLYAAELWFMEAGAYSVHVRVEGAAGTGTAVVPVNSVATRQLALGPMLGILLIGLGLLLAAGLISIVRAATGESALAPGEHAEPRLRRRGRIASGVAAILILLTAMGGRAWWKSEADAYRSILYEPLDITSRAYAAGGQRLLDVALVDPRWLAREWTPIVPDHGKLMHMFLVRLPDMDVFAHVHPVRLSPDSFRLPLPPLPAGRYGIYADVVHESGFGETLTDSVDIRAAPAPDSLATTREPDPDDAWWSGRPAVVEARTGTATARFDDGTAIAWARPADGVVEGRELELRFNVTSATGAPAVLEPYMGMRAHAVVRRDDGTVFVHLHPAGNIYMAGAPLAMAVAMTDSAVALPAGGASSDTGAIAETAAVRPDNARGTPDSTAVVPDSSVVAPTAPDTSVAMSAMAGAHDPPGVVTIPYAFPRAGAYRLWVQVRTGGMVHTAAFDVAVRPSR